MTARRGQRQTRLGVVRSATMNKSVVVMVERFARHPRYEKVLRHTKKYLAHDEDNACRVGDVVRIMETRPLSRRKRWRVVEILRRAGDEKTAGEEAAAPPA